MKRFKLLICLIVALLVLSAFSTPLHANVTVNFVRNTVWGTNDADDMAAAEAQIFANVSAIGTSQVLFEFHNDGPWTSSLTAIFFRDGTVIDFNSLIDADDNGGDLGVDFSPGASESPPQGDGGWTSFFETDRDTSVHNGVNNGDPTGEELGIVFDIIGGQTLRMWKLLF